MASEGSIEVGRALSLAISITLLISSLGFLGVSNTSASGPTDVSGIISQDTTWSLDESPYIVIGNILVANGATLTIEAGVEVRFSADLYLKVEGTLIARGNESAKVTFTSHSDSPEMLDWDQIEFSDSSDDVNCTLEHCEIKYARKAVYCEDASPRISNCIVSNCYDGIICEGNTQLDLNNNTIRDNFTFGVSLSEGSAKVQDNQFLNNRWVGISCDDMFGTHLIFNNTIKNHTRGIDATGGFPYIIHNTVTENEVGIFIHNNGYIGCWIWNNTVMGNDNGLHITGDCEPDIRYNNILNNSDYEVKFENERDMHAPFNYWGTTDKVEIRERIYDYQDDFNYGNFTFMPVLDGPSLGAPVMPITIIDTDGDGVPDGEDAFPDDPGEWLDSDSDGHGDNSDVFPVDPSEWLDSDSDGHGDNSDEFPSDPSEWLDSDGDGHGDNSDEFPSEPSEWLDSDSDGHGDNSDLFPDDPDEWLDSDDDGVGDNTDAFPVDRAASRDSDSDGHPDGWNAGMTEGDSETGLTLDEYPDDPSRWRKEDEDGPEIPILLTVVAIGFICLIWVGATEVGKAKLSAIGFAAYSRLKREKVLDQFTRGQIYGLIRGNPGINYSKVLETLKIGNGTMAYHLSVLEKEGFIKSRSEGTKKLFHPTRLPAKQRDLEDRFPMGEEVDRDHTLSDLQESIISIVKGDPGVTQAEIVSRMQVPKQTVSYNVRNLEKYGIIKVRMEGKTTRCYLK